MMTEQSTAIAAPADTFGSFGSAAPAAAAEEEPLLAENKSRFVLFPIRYDRSDGLSTFASHV